MTRLGRSGYVGMVSIPSAFVVSRQTAPHERLAETVLKHNSHPWRKPIADHSRRAVETFAGEIQRWNGPLILDTGCGTGMSTGKLARRFPTALVLGVDKSLSRLERATDLPENARLIRADLEDFWLLAREAGWKFTRQCFFYPNPWPKPELRLRRWPFHPVFPVALACGGLWEVRTNWEVYAREFALAHELLTGESHPVERWHPSEPETLFERKYQESGHSLWRWFSGSETEATISN